MTTATDENSYRVVFNDGEGIDPTDFTRLQDFVYGAFNDGLLMSAVVDAIDDPAAPGTATDLEGAGLVQNGAWDFVNQLVFAPFPAAGFFAAGGGARTLISNPGPLLFAIDELYNGSAESVAPFRLPAGITLTTAVGDGANPRIDLVEAKAEFVNMAAEARDFEDAVTRAKTSTTLVARRRVQLTVQIKQGTPAANPTYPACSGGFVPIAAVRVPATHNAVHSPDNIRDLRVPLGQIDVFDVPAKALAMPGNGGAGSHVWTDGEGGAVLAALISGPAASTGKVYAFCPMGGKNTRLVGIGAYTKGVNLASLVAVEHNGSVTPTITQLADLSDQIVGSGGTAGFRVGGMVYLMDQLGAAADTGVKGTRQANTYIGTPMWCGGYAAGIARPNTGTGPITPFRQLAVELTGDSGDQLSFVRFYVARGL